MSQVFPTTDPTSKPQPEISQATPSLSVAPSTDVAKSPPADATTGYRILKPAPDVSMGSTQELGQNRSPDTASQTRSRTLGVQSILNPSQPDTRDEGTTLLGSGAQSTTSPRQASHASQTALLPHPADSPRIRKRSQRGASIDEPHFSTRASAPRRTLTPRSPGRRVESLETHRQLPGFSDAPQRVSTTREGRFYTAEPGKYPESDIPPLPSATGFRREAPATSQPAEPAQRRMRAASTGYGHPPAFTPLGPGQSESPSTPHSSHSHVVHTSPGFNYGNAPHVQQGYQPVQATTMSGFQYPMQGTTYGESQYSTGQGSYQMTLDTEQGPMIVPVEVDLQQASKIADEKRKRNAGASARFRARRKEKEKEALHSISNMEKDVRDMAADLDFYINERNFFRELAMRHLGRNQIPPRPPSPPVRRPLFTRLGSEGSTSQLPESYREMSESSPRPAMRRRTGDYQPSLSRGTSPSPMLPPRMPFPSQFPLQATTLPPPPLSLPIPQGSYSDQRALPPGPPSRPPPPLSTTRSQSYDPFRPDLFDRSWDPGR